MVGIVVGIGIMLIIVGFLVGRFPGLIAGYNTMTAAQKAKVDIKRLKRFMQWALVVLGVLVEVVAIVMRQTGADKYGFVAMIGIVIAGAIFIVAFGQRYDHNGK